MFEVLGFWVFTLVRVLSWTCLNLRWVLGCCGLQYVCFGVDRCVGLLVWIAYFGTCLLSWVGFVIEGCLLWCFVGFVVVLGLGLLFAFWLIDLYLD